MSRRPDPRSGRSRYRLGAGNARGHALGQMGFAVDRASRKVREAAPDDEVSIPLMERIDGKRTLLSRKSLCLFLRAVDGGRLAAADGSLRTKSFTGEVEGSTGLSQEPPTAGLAVIADFF